VRSFSNEGEKADAVSRLPSVKDFAWFHCGCWLTMGGLVPSLLAYCFYKEVKDSHIKSNKLAEAVKRSIMHVHHLKA
jgi:hypothetical protein